MSQDVKISRNADGLFDLSVTNSVLETVDGLETAIIVSLATDARAPSSTVSTPTRRRGWVGNILQASTGRELGSILWTFDQSRLTASVLNDLAVAAQDCLQWMVEDNIAKSVAAGVEKTSARSVDVNILITTIEGRELRYSFIWRQTGVI